MEEDAGEDGDTDDAQSNEWREEKDTGDSIRLLLLESMLECVVSVKELQRDV